MISEQLKKALSSWPTWISGFEFDPNYGYLIDPQYKPKSFNYQLLLPILSDLHNLNANGGIQEKIKTMPKIAISKDRCHKDMVILHDACSYLIHSFIKFHKDKQIPEQQIVIPKNLAIPLAESASYLRVKTGMATGICYNWSFINQQQDKQQINIDNLTIKDIRIKSYYSQKREHEHIFMGVSVITCYCLSRIIKNCYEINCFITQQPNLETQVVQRMRKIKRYLRKIYECNLEIHNNLDKEFFFYVLRVFVAGYQNVFFQGINQRVSSSGGAGGYDPSFQTFERAFGINFEGQLGTIQEKLRNGMPQANRKLIDFMAENSLIRDYCECSPQLQAVYNEVIEEYVKYLELHGTFIKNFIIHYMPINATRSSFGATGATMIQIIDRYRFVRKQEF